MDELIAMLEDKVSLLEERDARILRLQLAVRDLHEKCTRLEAANLALLSRKTTAKSSESCDEGTSRTLPEPLDLP
jgi:hypothetical protein